MIEKARRLLDYFSQVNYGGEYIKTSCSVGIAFARGRSKSFARLYSEADDALYTAKKSGKGSFHIYNDDKIHKANTLRELLDAKNAPGLLKL